MAILAECPFCHKKQATKNKLCKCGADLDKAKKSKKVKYWISYYLPNGKQRRESVLGKDLNQYSIEDARKVHSKRVVQKAENRILDIKPDTKMTFNELTEWYLNLEKVKALSSYWRVKMSLGKFNSEFGGRVVSSVKPAELENYQARRKAEGKADATIDQEIGSAKTMIYKAFDNDKVSGDTLKTFKVVKKLLKANSNARDKILTRDQVDRLIGVCPKHIKPIVAMGFYAGMRKSEILNLTWNKVDLKNRVIQLDAKDTKDNEARNIPILDELYSILKAIPRSIHDDHVFLYKGKPVEDIRGALRTACKNAGISYGRFVKGGFIFHDLRHSFNTHMRKAGIQESVIMTITGHSTREMFDRYNTVDEEDTRKAIDQLQGYFQNSDQNNDQNQKVIN
ncbi:MAG: site-specific integrase [Deltaproteobacteria bacterium]|nr:site-specific integrase [Deltaproteobacteria bacterium]